MQPPNGGSKSPWRIVLLIGYASTIAGVWGYDMVACRGVIAGTASALLRLTFLVFVSPGVLGTVLLLLACCAAAGYALAALPLFRERKELLLFLLPVAALLVGISAATSGGMQVQCALSPLR
jgi:hypothetical protein